MKPAIDNNRSSTRTTDGAKTMYTNVTFKTSNNEPGSLQLMAKGIIFSPVEPQGKKVKKTWASIAKHQINKESSPKPLLKLVLINEKTYQFEMKDRSDLLTIRTAITKYLDTAKNVSKQPSTKPPADAAHESFTSYTAIDVGDESGREELNPKVVDRSESDSDPSRLGKDGKESETRATVSELDEEAQIETAEKDIQHEPKDDIAENDNGKQTFSKRLQSRKVRITFTVVVTVLVAFIIGFTKGFVKTENRSNRNNNNNGSATPANDNQASTVGGDSGATPIDSTTIDTNVVAPTTDSSPTGDPKATGCTSSVAVESYITYIGRFDSDIQLSESEALTMAQIADVWLESQLGKHLVHMVLRLSQAIASTMMLSLQLLTAFCSLMRFSFF